ncbi:uncharacterized protein LOC116418317 [Nasonia vitripennis]|uniref:Tf2-1-like SH3-like domain-containing protein n=1 Tax=Nasonia vitripennis TaxID=7425 RepID=A0A7M7QMI1_NASVI|nr:uncharacterized protein LOC116418317 [Nasonia vitripennis]
MYGTQPRKHSAARREQDAAADEELQRRAIDAWQDCMWDLSQLREQASQRAQDAQDHQKSYYHAKRKSASYNVGDLVMKRNHVLSSGAEQRSAKLAPPYIGPYKIVEIRGTNTYRLVDEVDLAPAAQLKPFYASATDKELQKSEEDGAAQPPRDASVDADRPKRTKKPRAIVSNPAAKKRGRPDKKVYTARRARPTPETANAGVDTEKKRPGRPKGSRNRGHATTTTNPSTSPRKTRAQRAADLS